MANNKKNTAFGIDKVMAFFLMLAVVVIPLIVRIRIVPVGEYEYGIIRSSSTINDMFSYNKAVAICVLAAFMIAYLLLGIILEEKRLKLKLKALPSYLMYAYVGLCLLSSVFSSYKSIAFWGISERYEGFFVLLSYGIFFIIAMSFASEGAAVKYMVGFFSASVLLIGIIGTMQTFGFDIFATTPGSKFVLGKYYGGQNLELKFESAYGTLYNPNCLGMYSGMMASFMLMLALLLPVKNKFKYMFAILFVLAFICMIGSDSVGGLLGFACACAFAVIIGIVRFFKNKLYKNKLYLLSAVAVAVVCVVLPAALVTTNSTIIQKVRIITDAVTGKTESANPYFYEDFTFDGNTATIVTKAGDIHITAMEDEPIVEQNGVVREVQSSTAMEDRENGHINTYLIDGLKEGNLQIYDDKLVFIGRDNEGNATNFLMRDTGEGIVPLDKFGNDVDLDNPAPSIGFKGIERLGSGRGYIWSRSIPLILNNIIIGSGPDSFALEFPQNDIIPKLQYLGNPYIIVDKPHSVYLQTAINTGLLSLIAILALVIIYIVQSAVKFVKGEGTAFIKAARLACMTAVIAYMAAAATTDSVISVAPLFWIMLGTGYGINFVKSSGEANGEA